MKFKNLKILVTGGAGFIGSQLVPTLLSKGATVGVLDNLSTGKLENISQHLKNHNFFFIQGDLLNHQEIVKSLAGWEIIFHLAANPEVRISSISPEIHFQQNIVATYNLLEAMRKNETVHTVLFSSTSAVYADAEEIPTPENYGPLKPISIYGASKLACEALISSYCSSFKKKGIIFRLANIVGPRSTHGVIFDFINKLKTNPNKLEILGDGTQTKSYLYTSDCIDAFLVGLINSKAQVEIYNVGSEDQINVKNIADIVIEEMELKNVKQHFTGGVDGGRGWIGDAKKMLLNSSKLKNLGWKPKNNSKQAVKKTTKYLISKM